jgi:hypothetical protein
MEGRIAHLRSHYRLVGAQVAAPTVVSRLDRILREEVIQNYDQSLESALAGDESVYVLRRVKARAGIVLDADATDAGVARNLGSHLAAAVVRAIARRDAEPGNVVRFENQADYVASFIVAVLNGTEQDQWFFEAFSELRTLDRRSAIRRALLDNVPHAPAILAYVHRYGQLDSLILNLDPQTKRALWSPESEQRDDLEISRSLFTTALQFLERLGGWTGPPPSGDEMFRGYWETDPPFADWRDPRSLAESVLEVVRYFFARGYLSSTPPDSAELSLRLGEALAEFEWLDRDWLSSSVLDLFDKRSPTVPDLPLRGPTSRATPRQRELLTAIAGAVSDAPVVSDEPLAAALKIFALLVNTAPGWAEDSAAKVMIENLLAVRSAMQATPSRAEFLKRLRRRDLEGALRLLSSDQRERAGEACRSIVCLGEPALTLLEILTKTEAKALAGGVESECAGMSLLVRTMLDARLHAFAEEDAFPVKSQWPPVVMLFILVAYRISGAKAFVDGKLDPGLCLLAGMDRAPGLDDLHAVWREAEMVDQSDFQKALLRIAAGQRLIEEDEDIASILGDSQILDHAQTGNPQLDLTTTIVTCLLLRMWARWLRGFSTSTVDFVVENFILRPGRLYAEKDVIHIELERRGLDLVVEMAGYFADIERVPWLGKRIEFKVS